MLFGGRRKSSTQLQAGCNILQALSPLTDACRPSEGFVAFLITILVAYLHRERGPQVAPD